MTTQEHVLAEQLVTTSQLLGTGTVHEILQRIAELAVETVPGCEHAGVSLVHGRKVVTPAASDAVALRLDSIQTEVGQGPCLDAIAEHMIFRTDELTAETRWPLFAARAHAETGVVSLMGIRLFARGRTLGALNLMSRKQSAFGEESLAVAALFAALAAAVLGSAQKEEDLQAALQARDIIGQAKGILRERHQITDEQAFQLLSQASQRLNVRLSEVATGIVLTGDAP